MIVFKAHDLPVYSLAFSPDGRLLASSCGFELRTWAAPYDKPIFSTYERGECSTWTSLAFSPNGRLLAWVDWVVRVLEPDGGQRVFRSNVRGERCCFSSDGSVLVVGGDERPPRRWATATWKKLPGDWCPTRQSSNGREFPLDCVAYHPDGRTVATASAVRVRRVYEPVISLRDATSGEPRATLRSEFATAQPTDLVFSPDGRSLAAIHGPHLRIWNLSDRSEVAHRKIGRRHFKGLAFTPDGSCLATVNNEETVRLWDTASWTEMGGFTWKIGKLISVAVAPDGMRMAAGSSSGKVVIWDVD
jgi:WD40 repeat protein